MTNDPTCAICGRPMPDQAYVCQRCGVTRPTEQLQAVADMIGAARDVAHGLTRRGGQGGASGKPGSRLPLDLGATSKLDAVQGELTTWVRHVAEERGVDLPHRAVGKGPDAVGEAAVWLMGHLGWARHRQEVTEALSGIEACARVVAGIARGPAEQKYLGPCGAETVIETATYTITNHCEGDVYGRKGASTGACRTCGATVDQAERIAWLDGEVRSRAFTARDIADAYGLNVKTIRSWAARGHLVEHGHDRDGIPQHLVGDVLDLAAADAARRAGEQAKRARRAAQVVATHESEDAA